MRVKRGDEKLQLSIQFFIWMAGSIAVTISCGVYLWKWEVNTQCSAPNYDDDIRVFENYADVSRRYRDVLKIFFSVAITDVFRSIFMVIAVMRQSEIFATLYQVLLVNDFLGFAAVFVLHAYRFSMSGRICAGDYQNDFTKSQLYKPLGDGYLNERGKYLIGLVCYVWVAGILFLVMNLINCCFKVKDRVRQLGAGSFNGLKEIMLYFRIDNSENHGLLYIQYFFRLFHSIALFVAVASYLWSKEVDATC